MFIVIGGAFVSTDSSILRSTPRAIKFTPAINPYAIGSVIAEFGQTKIHITVSLEESVPPFLKGKGQGWVTAEYNMLPGSTHTRSRRERSSVGGRTQEIQRLIGRSLRSVIDLTLLGELSLVIDCDVLVADGGTRTTSISGAMVALELAIINLIKQGKLSKSPLKGRIAALSVGINSDSKVIADLNYQEDSSCHTDMNIVMTDDGRFIEIQGTAEGAPFSRPELNSLLDCAHEALKVVFKAQEEAIQGAGR